MTQLTRWSRPPALWGRAAAIVLGLVAVSRPALAVETTDQCNTGPPTSYGSILTGTFRGQTFRPTSNALDFVEIRLRNFTAGGFGDDPSPITLVMYIHADSPDSTSIAQSNPVIVGGLEPLTPRFSFASLVPLDAGRTYAFTVWYLAGDVNWGFGARNGDPYPDGQIVGTVPLPQFYDAYFCEGVSGPLTIESRSWGRLKNAYRE